MNQPPERPLHETLSQELLNRPPARVGRRGWVWFVVIAILAAAGFVAWRYFGPSLPTTAPPPKPAAGRPGFDPNRATPVVAVPAKLGSINVYLNGLGSVTPVRSVVVRSRVEGQLMRVLFDEGQVVKSGQLLAEIDPRPFEAQLMQAEGQLARDQALLANARIDLERYRTLFAQDSIARQQVDTQEALVRQYEGTVKLDQGQVDNARLQVTYSKVTAPIGGRIGLRQIDPGNIVRASDANGIVLITQVAPIAVIFTIPQDNLPAVIKAQRSGGKIAIDLYDREQKTKLATGRLLSIDNQIDPTTGTVKLKAEFANEDNALFPSQFVNARMLVDTQHDVVLIPTAAVQRGAQGNFVYVVKSDQVVSLRLVKLGAVEGENVAITNGVAADELVVVDGVDRLREGARVELASKESRTFTPTPDGRPRRGGKGGGRGGEADGSKAGSADGAKGGSGEGAKAGEPTSSAAPTTDPTASGTPKERSWRRRDETGEGSGAGKEGRRRRDAPASE